MKKVLFFLIPLLILVVSFMYFFFPNGNELLTTSTISTPTGLFLGGGYISKNNPYEGWTVKSYTPEIDENEDGYSDLISTFTYLDENTIEIYINDTKKRLGNDKWVSAICNISGIDTILKSEYNPSTEVWTNTGELNHDLLLNYGLPSDWCNETGGYGFILFSAGTGDRQYRLHLPNGEKELSIKAGSGTETLTFVYQNISKVQYIHDDYELNATLYMEVNGNWNNTINDIFIFDYEDKDKFGANVTGFEGNQKFKYVIQSNERIEHFRDNIYYLNNKNEKIDFDDICSPLHNFTWVIYGEQTIGEEYFFPECKYVSINDYTLEITFYGYNKNGLIFIDPTIYYIDTNSGQFNDTTNQNNAFTHLNTIYDNLQLYYTFDNIDPDDVIDITDKSTDAFFGDVNFTKGIFGHIANFSLAPASSKYIITDTNDNYGICINDQLTVNFWINAHDYYGVNYDMILSRGDFVNPFFVWRSINNNIRYAIRTSNTNYLSSPTNSAPAGKWTMVTLLYDSNVMTIYINGTNKSSTTTLAGGLNCNPNPIKIGSDAPGSSTYLNGSIDELMVFNESLTNIQIMEIYNQSFERFYNTGTLELNQTITSGNNSVNITIEHFNQNNSNLSVAVYDGTSWSPRYNMTNNTPQNFTIDQSATVINVSVLFHSGNSFWSPILNQTITLTVWNNTDIGGGEPPEDTCTCPGIGSDHTFDLGDSCVVSTCNANVIDFTGSGSAVSCTGAWNVTEIDLNLGLWLINPSSSCVITTRD